VSGSELLIVGEAPDETDVSEKKLFVGKYGKKLRALVDKFNTPYSITNVCKCRPIADTKENRAPTATELKCCVPAVLNEIKGYENIVLVGGTALNAIFPDAKLSDVVGSIIIDKGKRYLIVYHPSYISRVPEEEAQWKKDLGRIGDLLSGYYGGYTYKVVGKDIDIDNAIQGLATSERFELDIEASSLDRFDFNMYCIGIYGDKADAPYVFPYKKEYISKLNDVLKNKTIVIHNSLYDLAMLLKVGIDLKDSIILDTMFMAYLMDENRKQSYGQKKLGKYLLDYRYWNLIADWNEVRMEDVYLYNAEDLIVLRKLYDYFWSKLSDKQKNLCIVVISGALKGVSEIEDCGMFVDLEALSSIKAKVIRSMDTLLEELKEYGDINWNSPLQVGEVLVKMGVTDVKRTKTNRVSLDKAAVQYMLESYPSGEVFEMLSRLKEYSTLETMLSTFLEGTFSKVGNGGRVRSSYSFVNTVSGRLASSKPNLQNVPRDSRIKSLFVAEKGFVFIEGDMSQVELRVAAVIANDHTMIDALKKGKDLHRLTASLVLGKQEELITKDERQKAKAVNFGFLYGQGWQSFKGFAKSEYDVDLSDKEAQEWRTRFFREYYGLDKWHKDVEEFVRTNKFIESPFGRLRRLHDDMNSPYKDIVEHAIRQAINSPVQGTTSDITLMLIGKLYKIRNLYSNRDEARLVGTVHDSFVLEIKKEKVEEGKKWIAMALKEIQEELKWFVVPIEVDLKVLEKWE
jgi:DNA polymerase-1